MPNYNYKCSVCEIVWEEFSSYDERDSLKRCQMCDKNTGKKVWVKMPGITKASYIDSNKTARSREMAGLKQAAKLEVEAAGLKPEDRTEIKKEIRKLKSIKD